MKRTILALALFGACLFGMSGQAHAGATTYRIEVSTPVDTPILLISGAGTLYAVDCSSGATSSYGMAFDSLSASGITVTTTGKAITPPVYSSGVTFVANTGYRLTGELGTSFLNGLVALTHGATINCLFKVGPSNGSLP